MYSPEIQIDNVSYNAATQAFEALVTITADGKTRRYPCSIDAPITMSFEDAAAGLARHALRRHNAPQEIYSQVSQYAPRTRAPRGTFSPRRMLEAVLSAPFSRTA